MGEIIHYCYTCVVFIVLSCFITIVLQADCPDDMAELSSGQMSIGMVHESSHQPHTKTLKDINYIVHGAPTIKMNITINLLWSEFSETNEQRPMRDKDL